MKRLIALLIAVSGAVLSAGCATLADAESARGSGASKVYEHPYDVVWDAVMETVKSSGLTLVSEDKKSGKILAQGSASAFSWGENVAIFVEESGVKTRTRVEVVSKRALATNITATNWEKRILEDLDNRL